MIRRQLPAYSPLPFGAMARGVAASFGGPDRRPELEALLLERYGAGRVILTGSGTQALQVALAWASAAGRVGAGVALPAFGCFDLATAAVGADVPVLFYDLEPTTLQPDIESLERALAAGAGTIVITPLYGYPVAWEPVLAAARRHGAFVVEDAAQGFGLEPVLHGDVAVLSFGRGKGWTGGRGGALMVAEGGAPGGDLPARLAPAQGARGGAGLAARVAAQWALGRPWLFGFPASLPWLAIGDTIYHEPVTPRGMEAGAAVVALETLTPSEVEVSRRREVAAQLDAQLRQVSDGSGLKAIRPVDPARPPSYLRWPVLTRSGMAGFQQRGDAPCLGLMPSYPRPLLEISPLKSRTRANPLDYPGARRLVSGLVTLPAHSRLTTRDLAALAGVLRGYSPFPENDVTG